MRLCELVGPASILSSAWQRQDKHTLDCPLPFIGQYHGFWVSMILLRPRCLGGGQEGGPLPLWEWAWRHSQSRTHCLWTICAHLQSSRCFADPHTVVSLPDTPTQGRARRGRTKISTGRFIYAGCIIHVSLSFFPSCLSGLLSSDQVCLGRKAGDWARACDMRGKSMKGKSPGHLSSTVPEVA